MKYFLMFISLAFLFYSCDGKTELIVEPINRQVCGTISDGLASAIYCRFDSTLQKKLLHIESSYVNHLGLAISWKYSFVSQNGDSILTYEYVADYTSIGISITANDKVGASIITKSWIDSDIVLKIAERNGGSNFRSKNPNYEITATLSEACVPNSFPVWYISYIADERLLIKINATDGKIIQ